MESVLPNLHRLHDARLRLAKQGWRCFLRRPHVAPKPAEKSFRFARVVELKLDDDVVRIVRGSQNLVAADARLLPLVGEAVEGCLPGVEVADWVFDLKDVHPLFSLPCTPNRTF
jgi:hypothetical protein